MKTIKEQAREYAMKHRGCRCPAELEINHPECRGCYLAARDDFKAGCKAALKAATWWIPVEEEPIDKGNILIALDYRGGVHTMFWEAIAGHNRIIQNDRRDQTFKYYTHWFPIPPMPEK